MGYPVNSPKDDFSFVLDETGTEGYLSSNRANGRGNDDIYYVKLNYIPVIIRGVSRDRDTRDILAGTKISVINELGDTLFTSITPRDGQFEFEVDKGKDYIINGQKTYYFTNEAVVETQKLRQNDETFVELFLEMEAVDEDGYPEPKEWKKRMENHFRLLKMIMLVLTLVVGKLSLLQLLPLINSLNFSRNTQTWRSGSNHIRIRGEMMTKICC